MCVSGVVCLIGEGRMYTIKINVDVLLSSLKILKTGLMLSFVETGDALFIDEFHEVFPYVS
jgi:hypothetical protein